MRLIALALVLTGCDVPICAVAHMETRHVPAHDETYISTLPNFGGPSIPLGENLHLETQFVPAHDEEVFVCDRSVDGGAPDAAAVVW